jgi:chromosome segregation ATPase
MNFPRFNLKRWVIYRLGGCPIAVASFQMAEADRRWKESNEAKTDLRMARAALTGTVAEAKKLREQVEALTAVIKQQEADIDSLKANVNASDLLIEVQTAKIRRLERAARSKPAAKPRVMRAPKGKKAPVNVQ